jgi:hypothetical protein
MENDNFDKFPFLNRSCCPKTEKILEGLKGFDLTYDTAWTFHKAFFHHKLTGFQFFIERPGGYSIEKHFKKIEETADLFEPKLRQYFLASIYKDVLENEKPAPAFASFRLKFQKEFERLFSNNTVLQNPEIAFSVSPKVNLTREQQEKVISMVSGLRDNARENKASKEQEIELYKKYIRHYLTRVAQDENTAFAIEKLEQEIALLDGSFDNKYLKKDNEINSNIIETLSLPASHREYILAYAYKVQAGIEIAKSALDWKTERGEKARQSYYTTNRKSKNYKEPSVKELSKVIELLQGFPEAQKIAINNKASFESL